MSKTATCPQEKISKQEQLVLLLKKAGWHEDRHVDISGFELCCQALSSYTAG